MTLALLFWILALFWLLTGAWAPWPAERWRPWLHDVLTFALLVCLGWAAFGAPVR